MLAQFAPPKPVVAVFIAGRVSKVEYEACRRAEYSASAQRSGSPVDKLQVPEAIKATRQPQGPRASWCNCLRVAVADNGHSIPFSPRDGES